MIKICIDAGHNDSGPDAGAEGFGLREQDINLDIAKRLETLLKINDFEVEMTRSGAFVPGMINSENDSLKIRCAIANEFKADIFISIHCNASGGTGAEIYIIDFGEQAELLAKKILPFLTSGLGFTNRGIKRKYLYVLKNTDMPAILTENGFIDNAIDAAKLKDPEFRQKIAEAHAIGICDFYNIKFKGGNDVVILKIVILKFTTEDEWAAKDVDAKHGGIANFTRYGTNKSIPTEAMQADQLIVIGGPTTGHKNEILLSGKNKYETATKVATYLGK